MKIITLMENSAKEENIRAEHGLSLYIETKNHKLLSDCGCTDAFMENAATLGVDLCKVDSVFLSHGHYDHSGGILPFTAINPDATIYMQQKALLPYYHKTETEERYIGIAPEIKELPQVKLVKDDFVIDKELALFSNVTGRTLWPKGNLELKKKNSKKMTKEELFTSYQLSTKFGFIESEDLDEEFELLMDGEESAYGEIVKKIWE